MMAYANNFVASIIVNNKPLREFNRNNMRTCIMPFHSEYSIKLKNKGAQRAMVEVSIDGTDVLSGGRLILNAWQTIDLERFVEGGKFKFISEKQAEAENQLQDPYEPNKGIVEIKFYREDTLQYVLTTSSSSPGITTRGIETQCNANAVFCSYTTSGVTVEGGSSSQEFISSSGFSVEHQPTVIRIKLEGPSENVRETYYIFVDTIDSPKAIIEASSFNEAFAIAKKKYEGRTILISKKEDLPIKGEV